MATVAPYAATSVATTAMADGYARASMRQLRHQHQQAKQERQTEGGRGGGGDEDGNDDGAEEEDDDLIPNSLSRHPDRRHNRQSSRLLDQPPQHQQQRPATSGSHLRYWHRQQTCRSRSPSSSKRIRPSSGGPLQPISDNSLPSMSMTKEEFEALPPTIQRKYFSTLERLRFARDTDSSADSETSSDAGHHLLHESPSSASLREENIRRPPLRATLTSEQPSIATRHRPRVHSSSARLYTSPADKLQRRPLEGGDKHPTTSHSYHKSVILDATDEAFVKIGKRQSQLPKLDSNRHEPAAPQQPSPTMQSLAGDETLRSPELKATADSIYESFRWLEEDDDLDLRLCFDEYQLNQRDEGRRKGLGLLFRRHLSLSKLPFGRASETISRPGAEDTLASPASNGSSVSSLPSNPGHTRRRSRALSLMSPNKTPMPETPTMVDPAASHYQDPGARMKLRVYLASPHKFDEAIEFGFPSIDEVQGKDNTPHMRSFSHQVPSKSLAKLHTSIDDELVSMCSDPTSPTDLSSPRTPDSVEQPSLMRPLRVGQGSATLTKVDYAHAPASSREMTLRMTLTRPDLRSNEEQIYGWQKASTGRKLDTRDGSVTPRPYTRGATSKDTIERQFAAMDQENLDNGVVKRFWNRVRRS